MDTLSHAVATRRTFAIISHPDAGKTTLTEKLLLFGGAVQLAGAVKARGDQRRARSDWLKVEQERGISVTASVMTFEHDGCTFNLLDTPGHEDFSEDTYRTLTAVDSAVMVIDAAKGIEARTRKLFEVCRMRDVPIITFINKMDREAREPFDLLDEIEKTLALDASPATWPIGSGRDFHGCYDLYQDRLILIDRNGDRRPTTEAVAGLGDPRIDARVPEALVAKMREEVELAQGLSPAFDLKSYREGHLTPVFFGSALRNFGVQELLEGLARLAPSPRPQPAEPRSVEPSENKVSGFVFKIQANMDPNHRDRVAFVRLCSGHFKRGMKLRHIRTERQIAINAPVLFMAGDRDVADEAYAGDIIGIPNHGLLRIGDSLTEGEQIRFLGVPSFAPELLRRVKLDDPMKVKHLRRALEQLAEEGASQVFRRRLGGDWVVGAVGPLQFDVLRSRLGAEYGLPIEFEGAPFELARWVDSDDKAALDRFVAANAPNIAEDHDGALVYLARNQWYLQRARDDWPMVRFLETREQHALQAAGG
ncbi:peptide chain release factor 3 [Zavarzinia sp. CC-PAN008]|uniref:peptide chain release factor 3 n=1 Tax=Zavarzinia sp. CC-PAN008 TaxID=3243332 RepID=UPI003F748952